MNAKCESRERPKGFWRMLLWRPWTSDSGPGTGQERPADFLRRRLASGEITPEDYESRMALLNRDAGDFSSKDRGK